MNSETKEYSVVILDKTYNIVSDEPKEHVIAIASLVDETMRSLLGEGLSMDQQRVMLPSLQLASKILKLQEQLAVQQKRENALIEWTDHAISQL